MKKSINIQNKVIGARKIPTFFVNGEFPEIQKEKIIHK